MKNEKLVAQTQIVRCHPLLVAFRLTKDRDLINIKTKVYVESLDDFYFYSSYYESFCNLCQSLRNNGEKNIFRHKVMSRRYQLQFCSCALDKKSDGGCSVVLPIIKRDLNSIDNGACATSNLIPSEIKKPFALIDLDFPEDPNKKNPSNVKVVKKENLNDRFSILERHSLENHAFDPLLLLFNHQARILEFINKCPESSNNFKKICNDCFKISRSKFLEKISNHYSFDLFFENILKSVFENDRDKNKSIHQIYHFLRKKVKAFSDETSFPEFEIVKSCDLDKLDNMLLHYTKIKSSEVNKIDESNRYKILLSIKKEISYVLTKLDANRRSKSINFDYPLVFLYLRGKTIANNFFSLYFSDDEKITADEKNKLKENIRLFKETIYGSGISDLNLIPGDLLNCFFRLNEWNVKQANSILKDSKVLNVNKKFKSSEDQIAMEIDEQEVLIHSKTATSAESQSITNESNGFSTNSKLSSLRTERKSAKRT